jgi:hypothetical protein
VRVSDDNDRPALCIAACTVIADPAAPVFTVKDVADACGLPQPVIAQLVPRSWTDDGWMYTQDQLQSAVDLV